MWLDEPLVAERRQVRDEDVVVFTQRREHVVAAIVGGGERWALPDHLVETKLDGCWGHKALVDEDVHGVRVISSVYAVSQSSSVSCMT
jgi:hypothetical protein